MDKYSIRDTTLTDIADAIRSKTKETGEIKVNEMAGKIGGISGSSEDLTAVLDAQQQLISELRTELEGKTSGGGASVETCTVNVNYDKYVRKICYTRFTNGIIEAVAINSLESGTTYTLNNVVCGSAVTVYTNNSMIEAAIQILPSTITINPLVLHGQIVVFAAPTQTNSEVTVYVYDND